jgi:hypothetical protein
LPPDWSAADVDVAVRAPKIVSEKLGQTQVFVLTVYASVITVEVVDAQKPSVLQFYRITGDEVTPTGSGPQPVFPTHPPLCDLAAARFDLIPVMLREATARVAPPDESRVSVTYMSTAFDDCQFTVMFFFAGGFGRSVFFDSKGLFQKLE